VFDKDRVVFDQQLQNELPAAIRLVEEGSALLTLSSRGVLTRWNWSTLRQSRQLVFDRPVSASTISADGSTAFFMQANGATVSFRPGATPPVRQLLSERPMASLMGTREAESRVCASGDGSVAVIQSGNNVLVSFPESANAAPIHLTPDLPLVRDISVSRDGSTLAMLVESAEGDRQAVELRDLARERAANSRPSADLAARRIGLQGGHVRAVRFLSGSDELLIARLNGDLLHLSAGKASSAPSSAPDLWASLDASPYQLAFDREQSRLAAACEDATIRILSLLDLSELARINVGQQVYDLSFAPDGNVLLVRTSEAVSLYELAHGQRVARWATADSAGHSMAGWLGLAGNLLIGDNSGVSQVDYGALDDLIRQQRSFATHAQIARSLQLADREDRWNMAERLRAEDAPAANSAEIDLVQALSGRQRSNIPSAWFSQVLESADPVAKRVLAFAAHEGGHFDWSGRALRQVQASSRPLIDAVTLMQLAECEYLEGSPADAADDFLRARGFPDADALPDIRLELETIAAFVAAGRDAQARLRVAAFAERPRPTGSDALVEFTAAQIIAHSLIGTSDESEISAGLKGAMVVFNPRWPLYADDIEFFLGEIARLKNNPAEAKARYHRCIDLARDPWPQSWARLRLTQLETAPQ
jgi:WD40 repeat protein